MRILLFHNPKAGREEHESERLVEELKRYGHDVCYRSVKTDGGEKPARGECDLVVAAGGDGTVGKVARHLIGTGVPLSVLPLGTANNLARTLGFTAPIKELVAHLDRGTAHSFDAGVARGPWGEKIFFEGAGAGLLADYLTAPKKLEDTKEDVSKTEEMKGHVNALAERLPRYQSRTWNITLDGDDVSDRYLLWEAMNIRSVGPVLTLAPGAETNDGEFDLVGVRETERVQLAQYLQMRLKGEEPEFPFLVRRFKKMQLWWDGIPVHFDDKIWPDGDEDRCKVEISVCPSALLIWKQD